MPEGPFLFAADEHSDQPPQLLAAELIREAAIRRTFQELPHALEVVVEEWTDRRAADRSQSGRSWETLAFGEHPQIGQRGEEVRVRALIWVESASQKGIVVGARGQMIRAIGSAARRELQRELGCRVRLDLSVRVRRGWRGDDGLLDRLGIT
jgi:GTPase